MSRLASVLAGTAMLCSFASSASAQCFNLDVGDPASAAGVPTNAYAAASGQAGVWNTASSTTGFATSIVDLSGGATSITTSVVGGGGNFANDNAFTTGDDEALMDDIQDVGGVGGLATWTFSGLNDGAYDIYTYAWAPDDTSFVASVTPAGRTTVTMMPTQWSGSHAQGDTFALHSVNVVGGSIAIEVETVNGFGSINGFQFVEQASCGSPPPMGVPILVPELAALFAADAAAGDRFGRCVDISGNFMVVGARDDDPACAVNPDCNSGSAYVFERVGQDWSQMQKITPGDGALGDDFGECVAISGNTIVVGAPGVDASGSNAGAIYVYQFNGATWQQQGPRLFGSAIAAEDMFGDAVDIDGNTIVAGARFNDGVSMFNSGNAYVFTRVGVNWSEQDVLVASDAMNFDQFGGAVSVDGDTCVVGARLEDSNGIDSGAAYVFVRAGAIWTQQQKLSPTTPSGLDEFGDSVSLDGNTCVIGAPFADRGTTNPGAAYVFSRSGVVWSEDQKLLAGDLAGNDRFGDSVSLSAAQLVIGASNDSHVGLARGSAYVFTNDGTSWSQGAKIVASDGDVSDEFGISVSIDGNHIGVGAWLNDGIFGADQGSAYAYVIKHATLQDFCFGDGGDQMGCTDCPCGNNARPGTRGGCLNGSGRYCRAAGFGIPSVSNDTLRFESTGANPSSFAMLVSNDNQLPQMGPCPVGSGLAQPILDGLRCAGVALFRHGARATDTNGAVGITNAGWGPPNGPPIGIVMQGGFVVDQTRHFTVFYREDLVLGCNTGTNTSNGISVTFVP